MANFSVVANAADDENLIDSDLSNWDNISDYDTWGVNNNKIIPIEFEYSSQYGCFSVDFNGTYSTDMYGGICKLTDMVVGQRYKFSIDIKVRSSIISGYFKWSMGLCYFKDGVFYPYDNIDIYECNYNSDSFTTNTFEFEYSYNGYDPYLFLIAEAIYDFNGTGYSAILFDNVSLIRQVSETEKKLDGILGWLSDIKDSISSLPETISSNLSAFFSDLGEKLTELKDNIKTNLETLSNNVTGKLGDVSTDFSDYVTSLGDRVSSFFSDLTTNITNEFTAFKTKVNTEFTNLKSKLGTEFTNLKSSLTTNFDNLKTSLSERFDTVDNFLTEIRDFFHNLYWDLVGGTCGAGETHSSLFERLGDRISGFFDDLKLKIDIKVEEIKTAIHDFFVPPEGFFEEWKAKFDLMLSDNLGFIYDAPDIIIGFVTISKNLLSSDTEPTLVFPEISFEIPGEYGGEVDLIEETEVDFSFLDEHEVFSFLYNSAYPVILHIIMLFALLGYAKHIWERTMAN